MKYKVGDLVRIKSIDWYNTNSDKDGNIGSHMPKFCCSQEYMFVKDMSKFCGIETKIALIVHFDGMIGEYYHLEVDACNYYWTEHMFDGIREIRKEKLKRLNEKG